MHVQAKMPKLAAIFISTNNLNVSLCMVTSCRAWCLYEVWHTVRAEGAKTPADLLVLTDNLYALNVRNMLVSVDSSKGAASRAADQEAILRLFR